MSLVNTTRYYFKQSTRNFAEEFVQRIVSRSIFFMRAGLQSIDLRNDFIIYIYKIINYYKVIQGYERVIKLHLPITWLSLLTKFLNDYDS